MYNLLYRGVKSYEIKQNGRKIKSVIINLRLIKTIRNISLSPKKIEILISGVLDLNQIK